MNQELEIIVAGTTCSGKSTMLYELQGILNANGFNVKISLEGNQDYKDIKDFNKQMQRNYSERIELLKKQTKITLKDMQIVNGKIKREEKRDNNC